MYVIRPVPEPEPTHRQPPSPRDDVVDVGKEPSSPERLAAGQRLEGKLSCLYFYPNSL